MYFGLPEVVIQLTDPFPFLKNTEILDSLFSITKLFAIYKFISELQKITSPTHIFCNYYIPPFNLGSHT